MKTYDETAESILERRTEYKKQRKRRGRVLASVLALCIAVGAGTGLYLSRGKIALAPNIIGGSQPVEKTNAGQGSADSGSISSDWAKELGEIVDQSSAKYDKAYLILRYNGQNYRLWDRTEEKFAGEYIGHTANTSDDGIPCGYPVTEELSCDISGEIYTVKSFGSEFMLCVKSDKNGKYYTFWNVSREVKTGADLIGEKAYNLKANFDSAQYQSHSDWDIGLMIYRYLEDVEKEDIEKLIDCICSSDIIDLKENYPDVIPHDNTQRHIILYMNENCALSSMTLRLYENGYVWLETLCDPGVFIKVDDPVFDKIYNAAKDVSASVEELKENGINPDTVK